MRSNFAPFIALLFFGKIALAQTAVTLEQCHVAVQKNWPLAAQTELLAQQADLQIENLKKNRLPQVNFLAQATLQNEVTKLPIKIPGADVPTISRDQYKIAAEGSYTLWDGGLLNAQTANFQKNQAVETAKNQVEMRRLREQVDLYFFQILLADGAIALSEALQNDLKIRLNKTVGAIENGMAIPANADALRAEILKIDQRLIDLRTARAAFLSLLSELTGLEIKSLIINDLGAATDPKSGPFPIVAFEKRPEFSLFEKQKIAVLGQLDLLDNRLKPRFSAFAQAGFGRPGFNFLNNEFRPFALVGLRANWSLSGFYTKKNDRSLVGLQVQLIENQRLALGRSLSLQAAQQSAEVQKIEEMLKLDPQIVELRERTKNTAAVQFENGTITANDYLIEANAENQARLAEEQRRVQLAYEKARLNSILNR